MRLVGALFSAGLMLGAAAQVPADISPAQRGKKIFSARCAKCHDENAAKKLVDGSNLLDRLAQSKDPKARLGTRIKNPDELNAVTAYISELLAARR